MTRSDRTLAPAGSAEATLLDSDPLANLLFGFLAASVIIRFAVPSNVLNLFMDYTSSDFYISQPGSPIQKLHPGTWGILLITAVLAPRIIRGWTRRDHGVMLAMVLLVIAAMITGFICIFTDQLISIGYLVDSVIAAAAAVCSLLCFSRRKRVFLSTAILLIIIFSSCIAIAEFATQTRFVPNVDLNDRGFRATGLYDHPLVIGLCNSTAIPLVYLANWSARSKAIALAILVAGVFAAGARAGAMATIVVTCIGFMAQSGGREDLQIRTTWKAIVLIGFLVVSPLLWIIVSSFGLTERFERIGLVDDSTLARLIIYQIFSYVDWSELIFGIGNATMTKYATQGLHLNFVESSLIVYMFQFGLVGTAILLGGIINGLVALGRRSSALLKISLLTFFIVASTNNTLSVKSPALTMAFALALGFREIDPARSRQQAPRRRDRAWMPQAQSRLG